MFSWFKGKGVEPVKKIKQIREYYTRYYNNDPNLPYQAYRVNFACYSLEEIYENNNYTEWYGEYKNLVPEEVASIIRANIVDKGEYYIFNRPKNTSLESGNIVETCLYCNNKKPSNSKCPSCGAWGS